MITDSMKAEARSLAQSFDFKAFNGKRILIAGANGHIPMWIALVLVEALRLGKADLSLVLLSRSLTKMEENFREYHAEGLLEFMAQDVALPIKTDEKFDFVFHFAGNASPHFIASDPVGILRSNIEGTFNMAELCRRWDRSKLIFASTREVYGKNTEEDSLSETSFGSLDPLDSRSCYPESKRAAESVIEAYHKQYDLRYAIARIAHVYGPGMKTEDDGRVMSDFIGNALRGEPIRLNSDGSALRSFCYVTDAVRALLMIAALPEDSGVYNLSNETEEISVGELARTIGALSGVEVTMKPASSSSAGLYCAYKRKALDCSRLTDLGWAPRILLNDGLRRILGLSEMP